MIRKGIIAASTLLFLFTIVLANNPGVAYADALSTAGLTSFGGSPLPTPCYDYSYESGSNVGNYGGYTACDQIPGASDRPALSAQYSSAFAGLFAGNVSVYGNAPVAVLAAHVAGSPIGKSAIQTLSEIFNANILSGGGGTVNVTFSSPAQPVLTIQSGQQVQLEWACQQKQDFTWSSCDSFGAWPSGVCINNPVDHGGSNSFISSLSVTGGSVNIVGSSQLSGSATVSPVADTVYTLACPATRSSFTSPQAVFFGSCPGGTYQVGSGGGTRTCCPNGSGYTNSKCQVPVTSTPFTLKVAMGVIAAPTATIKSLVGGVSKTNIVVGDTAYITANYLADTTNGDSLAATSINGGPSADENTSVDCSKLTTPATYNAQCWLQPDATKVYKFIPTGPGSVTFWANSTTYAYGWDHRASVTVTVSCSGAQHDEGGICVSNTRSCNVPNGSGTQTWNGSSWSACSGITCNAGYAWNGSQCLGPVPTLTACAGGTLPSSNGCSFNAIPSTVRKNTQTNLYWDVEGLKPINTCSITASPSVSGLPPAWNTVGTSWVNSSGWPVTITQKTVFTLSCGAPGFPTNSVSKTVILVPSFQEI